MARLMLSGVTRAWARCTRPTKSSRPARILAICTSRRSRELGIGTAVDKDEAARNRLACAGVGDCMLEHGDPVVFARQRGVGLAATPLLDGQEARLLPAQVVGVRVIDILI